VRIQLFGAGCAACEKMKSHVQAAIDQLQLPCHLEVVTRIADMIELGVTQIPTFAVNGEVVSVGRVLDVESIKKTLAAAAASEK
jgi:small redox-active disulfide protein 2